jgi:predicted dehydrogenase
MLAPVVAPGFAWKRHGFHTTAMAETHIAAPCTSHDMRASGGQVMDGKARIAVVGAGLIGSRHIAHIAESSDAILHAVVDPTAEGAALAARFGARHHAHLDAILGQDKPDGVILATPNTLHAAQTLQTVAAGIPTLVEKPIADDLASAEAMVAAARQASVPLLVGHHRRHNPLVSEAHAIIASGQLGRVIAAHAFFWLVKPPEYFDVDWRRQAGGGPLLINFIHDIDMLRYFCGEVDVVQAFVSSAQRGFAVEETAVVSLRFQSGVLGTITLSDAIAAPWNWEMVASENRSFPRTDQVFMQIGGSEASLALPSLEVWRHAGRNSWLQPLSAERRMIPEQDPLRRQIAHFARVIRGEEKPLVTGEDGLNNLRVVDAVKRAAASGRAEKVFP